MKKRIMTASILVPVLILVVLVAPKIVAAIVWGVLMMISVYELLYSTSLVRHPRMVVYSALMAFATSLWSYYGADQGIALLGLLVFWILLFSELMANHVKISLDMITYCLFAGATAPYLLSSLIRILVMKDGRYLILIPFVAACLSDAGAYFAGTMFGKHKLAPVVSPNKTVEGSLAGIGASVLALVLMGLCLQAAPGVEVRWLLLVVYGVSASVMGQFGDLSMSVVKRIWGVKDFGKLLPGHGGILDRFDSHLFCVAYTLLFCAATGGFLR